MLAYKNDPELKQKAVDLVKKHMDADESAAQSAAESAAESAARSAARSAAYKRMADKLIELLEGEKP